MKFLPLAAAALLLGAGAASAQTPAPQPAADIPAMKCPEKPTLLGERMMSDPSIRRRFDREMKSWGDCVKAYVAERYAAAKSLQEAAKAQADAGNAATNDYNDTIKKMNEAAASK
jgi:hypothetical protein